MSTREAGVFEWSDDVRKAELAIAGFEDGKGGHELRNTGSF